MRAIQLNEFGGPEQLKIVEIEKPLLYKPTQVLIKITAAGINPVDFKTRKGYVQKLMPLQLPAILGIDFCGVVEQAGERVKIPIGTKVFGKLGGLSNKGTYAEYCLVDTAKDCVYEKPSHLTDAEAAGVGVVCLTAVVGWIEHCNIQPGQKVLVVGASGGVGSYGVQVAKILGAQVVAICSLKNSAYAKQLGADEVLDYTAKDFEDKVKQLKVDHILDCVGGEDYYRLLEPILNKGGVYCTAVGPVMYGGDKPVGYTDVLGLVTTLVGRSIFSRTGYKMITSLPVGHFAKIAQWFQEKKLVPVKTLSFSFDEAAEAHSQCETNRVVGKVVLVP
ncbi:hypothetical protein EDD86DRAFT_55614 [Gorgonomyces haynaldii]|nr:hypothetical protein EDD86DRAFT_55614 [Gorgonomyces haynaldii]